MTVHAPFRFAPINRWVWFPTWGPLVSHDVPFKDGMSGEIEIEITAETPLLLGGPRRTPKDMAGELWPFESYDRDGNRHFAIPGSSLQGMLRSVLEIATFGKLGDFVEEKRFGIRDLTPPAAPYFQQRLSPTKFRDGRLNVDPRVETGWLRRVGFGDDATFEFRPCKHARLEYTVLAAIAGIGLDTLKTKSDVGVRYSWVKGGLARELHVDDTSGRKPRHDHRKKSLSIAYWKAYNSPQDGTIPERGNIVLTGNTSSPNPHNPAQPQKHLEFFFLDDKRGVILLKNFARKFDEFLSIHQPDDGRKANPNWEYYRDHGYGGQPFSKGGWMPIFYLPGQDGSIESFGLAFMFKLAHEKTTLDLLSNSAEAHLSKAGVDLPSLLFGTLGDNTNDAAAKRRVTCDNAFARLDGGAVVQRGSNPMIMLGPKPSYFPIYVRQPGIEDTLPGDNLPYATYTPIVSAEQFQHFDALWDEHRKPELSGVKIWPARAALELSSQKPGIFTVPNLPPEISANAKVQTWLNVLPAKTKFKPVCIRFHNLRRVELGALLWALTFGQRAALQGIDSGLRHRIGMGKPHGLGIISIRLLKIVASPNQEDASVEESAQLRTNLIAKFETEMDAAYKCSGDPGPWHESVQVKALLKAAAPLENANAAAFRYMELGNPKDPASYVGAKRARKFLGRYVKGGEVPPASVEYRRSR